MQSRARLICVGDPNQAIYAWRGASIDAMELLIDEWDAVTLPLSVCYRCPRAVVALAQRTVPAIEVAPGAPEGEVVRRAPPESVDALHDEDVVLCRNNAPLVALAYRLIAGGRGVRVLGREIGTGLQKLVKRLQPTSLEDLLVQLNEHVAREIERREKTERSTQSIQDRAECLRTFIRNSDSLDDLCTQIDRRFGGAEGRLTLSTVHKAKGAEWPQVAILAPSLLNAEPNLRYVAYTRAQKRLLLLREDT